MWWKKGWGEREVQLAGICSPTSDFIIHHTFSSSSTLPKQVLNKKNRRYLFHFFNQINNLNVITVLFLFVVIQPTLLRKTIVSDVSLVLFNDAWSHDIQAFPTVWKEPGNSPRVTLHDRKALDFRERGKWMRSLPSFMFSAFCWRRSLACRGEKREGSTRPQTFQ